MARPNRFNPGNQVRDLARRQADGLGGRTPERDLPIPEVNWGRVDTTPTIPTNIWNTGYLNDTFTGDFAPWNIERQAVTGRRPITYTTTRGNPTPPPTRNTFRDIPRVDFDEIMQADIDRRMQDQIERTMVDMLARTPGIPQAVLSATEVNDILARQPPVWANNARLEFPTRPDLGRDPFPTRPVNNRRTEGRRQVNSNSTEDLNYRKGVASRTKSNIYRPRLIAAMALGTKYEGKTFSYKPEPDHGIGTWFVDKIPVAKVNLESVTLTCLMLPVGKGNKAENLKLWNRTRFLWRQLGIKAVRYKDKTVVGAGHTGDVMIPGETWYIPRGTLESYVKDPKTLTSNKQGELFDTTSTSIIPDGPTTKPVTWTNLHGSRFVWNEYLGPNGVKFNLNNPPRPAEEVGGDSE